MPGPSPTLAAPAQLEVDWRSGQTGTVDFGRVKLDLPAGAFAEPVNLRLLVPDTPPPIPRNLSIPFVFRVEARSASTGALVTQLAQAVRFTVDFGDVSPFDYGQTFVNLYYFDELVERWVVVPARTDMAGKVVVADVDHFTDFGFGGDANSQPSTPSNLEAFSVDLCSGFASASFQFKVPPGTAGLTPQLGLRYNSGVIEKMNTHWIDASNDTTYENSRTLLQAEPVGFGWSLDIGSVARYNPKYAGDPYQFFLTLYGRSYELVPAGSTEYRTNPDEYLRASLLTAGQNEAPSHQYWLIEAKDGTQYRFGFVANSEMLAGKDNFGGTTMAHHWNLDQIRDTSGNTIDIHYLKIRVATISDPNELYDQAAYPDHIYYTANAGQGYAANRQIDFIYSDRTDHATNASYTYTQYYGKKKLDRIEMSVGGTIARKYVLAYTYQTPYWHMNNSDSQMTGLSKLTLSSITEKDAGDNALPATSFTYYQGLISGSEYYKLQLREVSNGYGGKTTYTYESHTPTSRWHLYHYYRVKQKTTDTGVGSAGGVSSTITADYTYGESMIVAGGYDYRGHKDVTVTDAEGNYEKSWFYTRDDVNGKCSDEIDQLQNRCYKLERWKSGGASASYKEETDWTVFETQGGIHWTYFARLDAVRQYQGAVSRKTTYGYDMYGNKVVVKEYSSATAAAGLWARARLTDFYPSTADYHYIVDRVARERVFAPSGDCLRETHYCYDGSSRYDNPIGSGLYGDDLSFRGRLTALRRVLDTGRCQDLTYGYDGFGHQTSMTEYGAYGAPNGPIASEDPRTTTATFESTYQTYPETVTNPLGQAASRSYDAKWGLPAQHTDPNGAVTNYTYDSHGRLTAVEGPQVSGPGGNYRRTTSYGYSPPDTVSEGGSNRTTSRVLIQVRSDLGGATPSWLNTRRFYDGIGRVVQEQADAASGVNVVNTYYQARGLKKRQSVPHNLSGTGSFLAGDWVDYSGDATTYTYDELRRPLVTTLPDGKTTETRYSGWSSTVLDQKGHAKGYDKDAFGRTIAVKEYSGTDPSLVLYATTSYEYDVADQLTKVTDAATPANVTRIAYDLLGRKVRSDDPDMGLWRYEYDALGNVSAQTDAKEQRIEFGYDALKRLRRTWYRPSWTQDPMVGGAQKPTVYDLMELRSAIRTAGKAAGLSSGVWANDEIWTDAEIVAGTGTAVRAVHWTELRDRVQDLWTAAGMGTVPQFTAGAVGDGTGTRKIDSGDPVDLRKWLNTYEAQGWARSRRARVYVEYDQYDGSAQFGKGRRTAMWDGCGWGRFWYDKAGRTWKERRTLDGHAYESQWTYDAMDRIYQMTYPDGEVLTYSYAANGLLGGIAGSVGSTTYLSSIAYNALNSPASYSLGSGTTAAATHTYWGLDAAGSPYGALKTIQLQQGSNPKLVDRALSYDFAGNVSAINDLINSENITYTYDHLDRLLTASAPSGESYVYNEIGNITSKNSVSFTYDTNHKHAVGSYNGTSYGYDSNGSMTTRGSQTIRYDKQCRPVRVDSGGSTVCRFAYDGDGVRRKRLDASGTVHYLGVYERNLGNGQDTTEVITKYYAASLGTMSRLIAFRKAGTLYYVGTDHLGSTIRVADSSFNAVDGQRYKPFGGDRDAGTNLKMDHKYTSQIEDASIGLYWYGFRGYDPAIGRFVAPDTVVPNPGNPQNLNRYSYALNNPPRYSDPTGHDIFEEDPGDGGWQEEVPVQPDPIPDSAAEAGDIGATIANFVGSLASSAAESTIAWAKGQVESAAEAWQTPTNLVGAAAAIGASAEAGPNGTIVHPDRAIIPGSATTVGKHIFYNAQDWKAEDVPDMMAHELGHVAQAAVMGPTYLPAYIALYGASLAVSLALSMLPPSSGPAPGASGGVGQLFRGAHAIHPMEIHANLASGQPI